MILLPVEFDRQGTLLVTQLFLPAAFPAACSRRFQPGMRLLSAELFGVVLHRYLAAFLQSYSALVDG
jgi:hypothetical protein